VPGTGMRVYPENNRNPSPRVDYFHAKLWEGSRNRPSYEGFSIDFFGKIDYIADIL